jgi:hypothetical protein
MPDQNWKPQSFTCDPQPHLEAALDALSGETDVNYDMVTRWISLADQALRSNWDPCKEA